MKNTKDIGIDLFEDYTNIPAKVQTILDKYEDAFVDGDYKQLEKANKELNKIGYTFEYYLDGQAYDLRPIGTKGKSEMDEFRKGGSLDMESKGKEIYWNIPFHAYEKDGMINIYAENEKIGNAKDLKDAKFQVNNLRDGYGMGSDYLKNSKIESNNYGYYFLYTNGAAELLAKSKKLAESKYELLKKGSKYSEKYAKGGSLDKENSDMVLNNNKQISHHTKELANAVNKNKNIPAWVVAKINRSATDISDATHYLEGAKYKKGGNLEFCYSIGGL